MKCSDLQPRIVPGKHYGGLEQQGQTITGKTKAKKPHRSAYGNNGSNTEREQVQYFTAVGRRRITWTTMEKKRLLVDCFVFVGFLNARMKSRPSRHDPTYRALVKRILKVGLGENTVFVIHASGPVAWGKVEPVADLEVKGVRARFIVEADVVALLKGMIQEAV